MSPNPEHTWTPSRELLAAFADGELDNRPHLDPLVEQMEAWLAVHPEAFAELETQMELTRWMAATAAEPPSPATWSLVWQRILKAPRSRKLSRARFLSITAVAAAAAVVFAVWFSGHSGPPPSTTVPAAAPPPEVIAQRPLEVLEVATADEVEIMRVGGADTTSLVNVNVPLTSPIELLSRHEVEFRPPANNAAGTEIRQTGSAPVVWTPLPGERDEEEKS